MKNPLKTHAKRSISRQPLIPDSLLGHAGRGFAAAALALTFSGSSAWAATQVWTAAGNGNFGDPTKYASGVAPVAGDTVTSDGTGSIINFDATNTLSLTALNLNLTSGATTFNQTAGNLALTNLGFGGAGGSRNPVYNLSGGTLSIATSFAWGNGSNARFNVSAGTVDFSGTSLSIGIANGAKGSIIMTGGTFNANSVTQINLANSNASSAQAVVDLSGNAQLNATAATFVIGQFGAATGTGVFATLNLAGTSQLNTPTVVLGGNNAASAVYGVINLNGGTLSTGVIRKGSSTIAASSTTNVLNANGGTIKATLSSGNFFNGIFVNLLSGGLKFDTNSNSVTLTNALSGAGGVTKQGPGNLTLSSSSLTYLGNTTVNEGTLSLPNSTLPDTANVSIAGGDVAKLDLAHGLEDAIGTLTLGGIAKPNGVYGSSSSAAPIENQDDTYFTGTGTVRVGPVTASPRNLVWEGLLGQTWSTSAFDTNFLDGATQVQFLTFDHVAFNDITNAPEGPDQRNIFITGVVQPTSITFNNSSGFDYTLSGGTIGGTTGIVKNGTGTVFLGGNNSTYSGPITVNAGRIVAMTNKSFGTSSGITIASGAQIDLNGKTPGALYTLTLNGAGPSGSGAIVNGGVDILSSTAIKNLILSADAVIGNDGGRFDICSGGTLTGNSHSLTKVGNNGTAFRGTASATPINIIASAGSIWAEASDAFGGATGTLTVKSGARAGSYGTRSITTPTTLESGGMINNLGNGKGTWSGPLSLTGNVTFESGATAPDQIDITGTVTGTANVTKQGTALVTVTHPTYAGNTTVNGGQLSLLNAELSDTGKVSIAGSATLNLPHGLDDTVGTLFLNGVQVAAGTYGATGNLTAQFTTDRIVGTGRLVVTNGPVVNPFDAWANANITNPAYAALKGRLDDPDDDGFTNVMEFLFGTNPETNTGSLTEFTPGSSTLIVRWNERNSGATYLLKQSTTLENPWLTSEVVPVSAVDQTGVPSDYTRKQATIPIDNARKFIRVNGAEN